MRTVEQGPGPVEARALRRAVLLQCVVSIAGTMIGQALGNNLTQKLIAGVLLALVGAFLTAPGKYYHRRIVAVALMVALLYTLRRAARALASSKQESRLPRRASRPGAPNSWSAIGLIAIVGFCLGSLATTTILHPGAERSADPASAVKTGGSPAGPPPTIKANSRFHDYTKPITISGRIANHRAGIRVTLHATTFPYGSYKALDQTSTKRNGYYRFTTKADLATRYRVSLKGSRVRSRSITVYAGMHQIAFSCRVCAAMSRNHGPRGPSTLRLSVTRSYPTKVYDIESAKHWYFYYGQTNGAKRAPALLRLVRPVKQSPIGGNAVRITLILPIQLPLVGPYEIYPAACTQPTRPFNGFLWPHRTGCGEQKTVTPRQFNHDWGRP